jgi:hypothetical protein
MPRLTISLALMMTGILLLAATAAPNQALSGPQWNERQALESPVGTVLQIYADVSGSTLSSDPDRVLSSIVPAAAYVSGSARVFVGAFAATVGEALEVQAASGPALQARARQLADAPRGGSTATAAAVGACLDNLEEMGAVPGSGCLVVSDGRPEPDTQGQLRRIEEDLAPRAARDGFHLMFVGLGSNDPQGEVAFRRAAALTGAPPYLAANDPKQLAQVLLALLARWKGAWPADGPAFAS